ncbi:glycosyltransferase [Alphaproteobacteria bacterium]|nr:glycosyltransferase [Alphaproteobacteria bacterium]
MCKTKIIFLTPGIQMGGAERQLASLARGLMALEFEVLVISLTRMEQQPHFSEFDRINVVQMDLKKNVNLPIKLYKLKKIIKKFDPDIVQGWMYSGNIAATILSFGMKFDLYHSIRASNMDLKRYGFKIWLNRKLAVFAKNVIVNSFSGLKFHESIGFNAQKMFVILNGIDTTQFKPNKKSRDIIRQSLGINKTEYVIVYAARVDPMKGHEKVLGIARLCPNIKFILVGKGTENLKSLDNVIKLGLRHDMNSIYCGSDALLSLSNFGEGFPNVIGEAMACGLPVLANDVGDSWHVIGKFGCLLDASSIAQLAQQINSFIQNKPRIHTKISVSEHINNNFSNTNMVKTYHKLYLDK